MFLAGGTVTFDGDTFSSNAANGGAGGSGGAGGTGALAGGLSGSLGTGGGTTGFATIANHRGGSRPHHDGGHDGGIPLLLPTGSSSFFGGGAATGGNGGPGGDGGKGQGGGLFVAGGSLTLLNNTIAENSAQGGAAGSGGPGGKGGSLGLGNGASGSSGHAGTAAGGGFYIDSGTVNLYNSTIADNDVPSGDKGGGLDIPSGTVILTSTIVALNTSGTTASDIVGTVAGSYNLIGTGGSGGLVNGKNGNKVGVTSLGLGTLAGNGGPTQTIALERDSPAIGQGSNPETLFTDQRGYDPRTGAGGTDIGAYQYSASADTSPPTASLSAPEVTASNASSLNPYDFTITYSDNTAVAVSSMPGVVVQVSPPGGAAPITATVISTQATGSTDAVGNAQEFVVTYQITPPGGSWSAADSGTYTVTLGGTPVTDLSGNAVATGPAGTFSVNITSANQASATFLAKDTMTQGTWMGTYGSDGYNVIGATPSYPSYATVTASGYSTYTWSSNTSDVRGLQNPDGSGRIAAAWYGTSFTVDVNLTDGQAHDIALYAVDWDDHERSEQIQITDVSTGAVLDTETLSSFTGGAYEVWSISGHVKITITELAGGNALLNGLFFGTPIPATATFVNSDTVTQGTWMGIYGADGYNVVGATPSYPSYATVTASGYSTYTWSSNTSDVRGLQNPDGSGRIAAAWYGTSFTVDVNLTDGQAHDIALYAVDWDDHERSEQIQITDVSTGAVLDTETLSSFKGGAYEVWSISGHVKITITELAGGNAVLNGLFFGTPIPPPPAAATFVTTDTTTQGTWMGTYGADGYDLVDGPSSLPSYATVSVAGNSTYVWSADTTNIRGLENPSSSSPSTNRIAAAWYGTSFTLDVNLTDGQAHDIALYAVNWDDHERSEQIQITDAYTGAVLDTETLSSFTGGAYEVWSISGHVKITISVLGGGNAVLNGLFFEPAVSTTSVTSSAVNPLLVTTPVGSQVTASPPANSGKSGSTAQDRRVRRILA